MTLNKKENLNYEFTLLFPEFSNCRCLMPSIDLGCGA